MDKPWKVIFSFLVVFLAGGVVGGLYFPLGDMRRPLQWKEHVREDGPKEGGFADRVMHHYTERLELTAEQVEQIRPIVEAAGLQLKKIRMGWSRNTASVANEMNQAVIEILTPKQKVEFEELILRQMKERMQRMGVKGRPGMENRPPPPPPPVD